MSNTIRKARKRARRAMFEHRGTTVGDAFLRSSAFLHPVKTGTPVPNREENQPFIHTHGGTGKVVNSASSAAKRRLAEYEARTRAATRGLPWPDHRRASRAA